MPLLTNPYLFSQVELQAAIVREPLVASPDTMVMSAIAQMSGVRSSCEAAKSVDSQLAELYLEARSSCVLVVERQQILGILTERDVVRLSAQTQDLDRLTLAEVAVRPVITLLASEFTDLFSAVNLLQQHHIRHLPLLDDRGEVVGLLTHESLRHIARPIDLLRLRRVEEVMTQAVICASPAASLLTIARQMAEHRVSSIVIVEPQNSADPTDPIVQRPIGMITERDLVQFQALGLNLVRCQAAHVMSSPIFTVRPEDNLLAVQQIMEQRSIRRLVVTGTQQELLGIVTQTSLLKALNPLELYNLVVSLEQQVAQLEAEQVSLRENQTIALEQQVQARTAELQTLVHREKLLADLATKIRISLSLPTILETAVTQVRQALGCDRVTILQFETPESVRVVAESTDSTLSLLGHPMLDDCFRDHREKYRQGHVRVVPDIYTTEMADCHRQALIQIQTRSKVLLPILCEDQLWGLLNAVESEHPRDWTPEEVELLQAIATQVAIAIQQSTVYQRLKQSEARYVSLTELAPVGIFRTDAGGNCLFVNDRWCQLTGLSFDQSAGQGWQQAIHPDDRDWITAEWYRAAQENRSLQMEYRYQRPDGSVIWVYGQSAAEYGPEGSLLGYVGTVTDISDRKQLEIAQQESQKQLNEVLDTAIAGLIRLRFYPDFAIAYDYISPHCEKNFGYTVGDLMQDSTLWTARIDPQDWAQTVLPTFNAIVQQRQGAASYTMEYRLRRQDNSICWILANCHATWSELDQCWHITIVDTDITDLKQTQLYLAQSETQNRAILAAIPDLMFRLGADGVYRSFANPHREIDIISQEIDPTGKHTRDLLPPELVERQLQVLQRAIATGELQVYEQQIEVRGRQQYEEVRVFKSGEDEALFMIRDISDRKQAEQQLQQLNQSLEVKVQERTAELWDREQFLQTVLDTFPLAIFWKDRKSVMQGCNQLFASTYGLSPSQVVGKTTAELAGNSAEAKGYQEDDRQVMESGLAKLGIEETLTLPTGEQRWIETNKLPLRDLEGNVVGVLGTFQDITDRKVTEIALRESEEKFRQLAEVVDAVFWVLHLNRTERVYVSPAYERIWGRPCQELYVTPDSWVESIHPQDREYVGAAIPKQVQGEYDEEYRIIRPDGEVRWIRDRAFPIHNDRGEVYRIAGIAEDITDRKRTEKLLRQKAGEERLLASITQRIRASLNLKEILESTVIEARKVLQCDRVLVYRVFPNGTGAAIAESVLPSWPHLLDVVFPEEVFPQENYDRYLQGRTFALTDREAENSQVLPCLLDFLSEIQVRAKLVIPIVQQNTLWGLLISHHCSQSREWQAWEINLMKQIAGQLAIAIQQANLVEQLQQELTERLQAQQQITERNQQLALSNEQLARATRMKDEFLANMSHELRTPLNAILGMAEGLQEGVFGEVNPKQRKSLETIDRSATHLLELINDILDLAKVESGHIELNLEPTEIGPLCKASLSFVKHQALKKQIQLDIKQPFEDIPDLLMDERRIRQVLINLLNNAVKFTPAGGRVTLEVGFYHETDSPDPLPLQGITRIKVYRSQLEKYAQSAAPGHNPQPTIRNYLRISVIDTGIGIDPEHLNKLFQPFVQIDSALNRQHMGTGLGLALVKRIVELHGGQVGVISEVGVGSRFTIDLPWREVKSSPTTVPRLARFPHQAHPVADAASSEEGKPPPALAPLVLITDDNEANVRTTSSYLRAKGYRIISAQSGQGAIDLVQSEQPDLILMDIQMPGMDGLEAIRRIRQDLQLSEIPIVALTALAMAGDRDRCLAAGANEYLGKPVKLKQLTGVIQQLLASRGLD